MTEKFFILLRPLNSSISQGTKFPSTSSECDVVIGNGRLRFIFSQDDFQLFQIQVIVALMKYNLNVYLLFNYLFSRECYRSFTRINIGIRRTVFINVG